MAETRLEIKADVERFITALRIIARHASECAAELEALRDE